MLHQHEIKLEYQKWDCVNLSEFRSKSAWNPVSYFWLWVLAAISVSVYGSDTFTAINLLAYDRWSGELNPTIPFYISKWIFAGCIFLSWGLLLYEWLRALRVIRRGNVAESYLDPLAVVLQSMRLGGVGKGWRRFLVFAALTKSKKGADYVALFAYFQFKGAIRILFAEAPRQVINAVTLYSVLSANLIPTGDHAATANHSGFEQFWINVEILYKQDKQQAVILSTMLFTLIIFVFSALSLAAAVILYFFFLWHYIPRQDGTLARYCRRKVNTRLERIVNAKAKQGMADDEEKRRKEEEKANGVSTTTTAVAKHDDFVPAGPARQPTLPNVADGETVPLNDAHTRTSSTSTSPPPYGAAPDSFSPPARQPTLPTLGDPADQPPPRQGLVRAGTESTVATNVTYGRHAPVRQDTQSTVATNVAFRPPPPIRTGSQSTVASNISYGPPLHQAADEIPMPGPPRFGRPGPPPRSLTQSSSGSNQPLLAHQSSSESMARNFSRRPMAPPQPPPPQQQQQQPGPSYEMSQPQRPPTAPPQWSMQDAPRAQSPGPTKGETPPPLRPGMRPMPPGGPFGPDSRGGRPTGPPGPGRVASPGPGSNYGPRPGTPQRGPQQPMNRPINGSMNGPRQW